MVDCIEFNERFRHADPIAELAFLAMELRLRGRLDLADRFVEAYLGTTGDQQGRLLLPFYRAYRAAVRAKVEGMKLAETEVPEAGKVAARDKARALWLFGLSELAKPDERPCLVLVAGLPGAGKVDAGEPSRQSGRVCGDPIRRRSQGALGRVPQKWFSSGGRKRHLF